MPATTFQLGQSRLTLDARPDRLDLRDLVYQSPLGSLPPAYPDDQTVGQLLPAYLANGLILDQGSEGACTGFGLAAVINYLRWLGATEHGQGFTQADRVSPRMLYHLARFYDEWEGEDYNGSSCRGALKGWHRHGVCLEALWPYNQGAFVRPQNGWDTDALTRPLGVYYRINKDSVVDMQAAIREVGAIYVSAQVHEGWGRVQAPGAIRSHADLPLIPLSLVIKGGHAFAIVGYNAQGFVVQNSWGDRIWGRSGFAVLTYVDWVANGSDAWAVSMGVPTTLGSVPVHVGELRRGAELAGLAGLGLGGRRDPLASRPGVWDQDEAYRHTLVTGNDGLIINRLPQLADAADAVRYLACEQPELWFGQQGKPVWRLAIYAHGGLNAEADSIRRIRVLGPSFKANGIYPLFTTWKSGWLETLGDMLDDTLKGVFGEAGLPQQGLGDLLTEGTDRMLEVACRYIAVRGMWSEMKENVERGTEPGRGLKELGTQLNRLATAAVTAGSRLEIHLIGHSAGAFVAGRMLGELAKRKLKAASCTLFAPACDLDFAVRHYVKAVNGGVLPGEQFRIHVLSDQRELDDCVGPYRKSLLYLIHRALEPKHRTPVLGMERVYNPGGTPIDELWHRDTIKGVKQWQEFVGSHAGIGPVVLSATQVDTGASHIDSTHGCFDNSQEHIRDAITRILGGQLVTPLMPLDF